MKYRSFMRVSVFILFLVALDQGGKYAITRHMLPGERIDLLPFFSLYHTRNTGIAFSMLSSFHDTGLVVLTIVIICFVLWLWHGTAVQKKMARLGYLFVIGGALGNLIDRLRLHYVTDYALFYLGDWSFAIFNLADAFITVGAVCIIFNEWQDWRRERRA